MTPAEHRDRLIRLSRYAFRVEQARPRAHTPCPNLPAILAARLRRAGMQPLRQTAIPILNTSYNPASFSYWVAQVIRPFVVSRQSVPDQEAAEWLDEFARLEESGTYFFSLTPVLTEAAKIA